MLVSLVREENPVWTEHKQNLLNRYPERFVVDEHVRLGGPLTGIWLEVHVDGQRDGYGWLTKPEDMPGLEVQLCLENPGQGTGTHALRQLEEYATSMGVDVLSGVLRSGNEFREKLLTWLESTGFEACPPPGWTVALTFRENWPLIVAKRLS